MRSGAEAALHPASTPEAGAFFHNALIPRATITYKQEVAGSSPALPTSHSNQLARWLLESASGYFGDFG